MSSFIWRSILLSIGFMLAFAIFSPLGLGWLVFLAFLAYMVYAAARAFRGGFSIGPRPAAAQRQPEGGGLLARLRMQTDTNAHAQRGSLAPQGRDEDCGLTHDERSEFNRITKGLGDAG